MLVASRQIGLFDRYRVPYTVDENMAVDYTRIIRADGGGAEVLSFPGTGLVTKAYRLCDAVLQASLADPAVVSSRLASSHGAKQELWEIGGFDGSVRAGVARMADGTIVLPFDIDEPFDNLLFEHYLSGATSAIRELARRSYYRARPVLPYRVQLGLRRRFQRLQDRASFPAWPIETSLHRLETIVLSLVEEAIGEPIPWISPWPAGIGWAVLSTHDVERVGGYRNLDAVLRLEEKFGVRSAWYFVPERDYTVEESVLEQLRDRGCEICLHGLHHDGRDLAPGPFEERLPAMRSYLERWDAHGFRGPSTHRDPVALQRLGVEHDSSWSDVARYEPQPGGTCSWLPFFIGDVVELPITLAMDHTLFELQRLSSPEPWITKSAFLREVGGMALLVTHPDYLVDADRLDAYEGFLSATATDSTAWWALPREVAAWWRRRAQSTLVRDGDGWRVEGPAAGEGVVRLGAPALPPLRGGIAPPAGEPEALDPTSA